MAEAQKNVELVMYVAIAHRWGWMNGHWYHVYAGPDQTKALALAQNVQEDRGGKYGCAVMQFDGDGTDYKRIAYFPSMHGEEKPYHNYRIDMFESLGHVMHDFARGTVYLPDGTGRLKPQKVAPPEWVADAVNEAEKRAEIMADAVRGVKATAEDTAPPAEEPAKTAESTAENGAAEQQHRPSNNRGEK